MPQIHTVTLNPAIDQILYLSEFQPEVTNRLTGTSQGIGGKGTHVSINLKLLGLDSTAFGISFGDTGLKIMQMLRDSDIHVRFLHDPDQESRTNYLLIEENGKCACLSSQGVPLSEEDISNFIQYMDDNIEEGDYLVLSGDATNCPDPFVYHTIMTGLRQKHLRIFLDASGEALRKGLSETPYLIKPNRDEFAFLCGMGLDTEDDLWKAMEAPHLSQIPVIAVSLGAAGSAVRTPEGCYRCLPPEVHVKNTIGCGDSFLSGIIYGIYNQLDMEETLRIATAVSAATAESALSVGFDLLRFNDLKQRVTVKKIS